jgi:translation initiation factor 2 subunit 2
MEINNGENNLVVLKNHKFQDFDRQYDYLELLDRFLKYSNEENIKNVFGKKLFLPIPKLGREGTKKTIFLNFDQITKKLNRNKEHLFFYFSTELGVPASIQEGGGLVLKGRFQPKGIENILKNYIKEYVLCGSCTSAQTILKKDNETRLFFIRCLKCDAWRSVNQIKAGFVAQLKKKKVKISVK